MKTSTKALFFSMMIISTIMVISSSSWLNMWIGLEINLMSFVPLISTPKNTFMSQSTMMYFLVQSLASMMFIIIILMNKYIFTFLSTKTINTMLFITMMMKMGMPPFHMWFPEMINKMSWIMCLMMMTWQKIAPMYIMSMIIEMNTMLMTVICLTAVVGAIGGMNQTSTRKIMAYSSINHMSWMVTCASMFKKSWMTYMIMYAMIMTMMSVMLYKYNILHTNQMNMKMPNYLEKMIIVSMMLSIGGLPPFLGFLPKWITIQYMISNNQFIMMIVMTTASLITLAYYMRMTSSMNLTLSTSQKWMNMTPTKKNLSISILSVNLLMPMLIFFNNFL